MAYRKLLLPGLFIPLILASPNFSLWRLTVIHTRILILLPVSGLLVWMTLTGNRSSRRNMGWRVPELQDIIAIPVFTLLTLSLGVLFPGIESDDPSEFISNSFVLMMFLSILSAVIEELYFRSWLIVALIESGLNKIFTVGFSVLLFASLHLWQGWLSVLFACIAGALYSSYFYHRRCITTVIMAHVIHNTFSLILVWYIM